MKKLLLSVAILGIMSPSCVKNDPEFTNDEVRIGFDSPVLYSNADTKVSVFGEINTFKYNDFTYTYPRDEKFKIFGVHHQGFFTSWDDHEKAHFNDTDISYNYKYDSWVPVNGNNEFYYWHDNYKLSYAAMSPANLTEDETTNPATDLYTKDPETVASYGANGLKIKDYEIPQSLEKQYDLLYSELFTNATKENMLHGASGYSGLPITFKHALSQIRFSLRSEVDEDIILNKISVSGLYQHADFQEIVSEGSQWNNHKNSNSLYDVYVPSTTEGALDLKFPVEAQYVSALIGGNSKLGSAYPLFVIPQSLSRGTNETPIKIHVEYQIGSNNSVTTKDITISNNVYYVFDPDNNNVTNEYVDSFVPGHRYVFRLNYSSTTHKNDMIYFAPSTEGWLQDKVLIINL